MPRGFVLQPTYRIRNGVPVVLLYGRLESGDAFLIEDHRFRPYFFLSRDDARHLLRDPDCELEKTSLRDLDGREVVKVVAGVPAVVPRLREKVERAGGRPLESDIRFPYRYLIDHGIRSGVDIHEKGTEVRPGFQRFVDPVLTPGPCRPELSVLSIDLETSFDASEIFSAALVGAGADEVHLRYDRPVEGAIVHEDERSLLAEVTRRVRELDPDIVTGWNVVDFDLSVWTRRCAAQRVACDLGRSEGGVAFHRDQTYTRQSRADIPGRMVLDGTELVRDAVRLDDYRLETVARALLGRGKLIDHEVADKAAEIARLYREEPEALVAYNREDSRLVLDILDREGLLELAVERSLLSGMQLDRVGASIASFDLLYLPELRRHGFVAPSVDTKRKTAQVKGGALLDPQPGLFRNVAVFDFRSLYPSLICTFNLDPLAHARAESASQGDAGAITAPNGARFARDEAILPEIIERFVERRAVAKQRGDRHADQAIKIMMNALFGVLGAGSCRFFSPEIANAITGFGQQTLAWTSNAFREEGVSVLYGDTDSVFVQLDPDADAGAARAAAESLRARVEKRVAERIRQEYDVEPRLDLELELVFERFLLPRVRGGRAGSKKRYAGWLDGHLEVVGLESVRRDWPAVAKRLQRGMLERVFTDRDVVPFLKETVQQVRAGELDEELVYVKRVRKGSVERYTATTPPHVQAARKAGPRASRVIRYVIAKTGPEPVLPGEPMPGPIDTQHYVDKVLEPIANAILVHLGRSFDEVLDQPRQLDLL